MVAPMTTLGLRTSDARHARLARSGRRLGDLGGQGLDAQ